MNGDGIIINLEDRKKTVVRDTRFVAGGPPSQDAIALAFVRLYSDRYRYVPAWQRWIGWDGKRWAIDHHNAVSANIRTIIREAVGGTRHERRIATANYIRGAEQMARYDPTVVLEPSALDADPWLLNTQADIVNLRDGSRRPHEPAALITRITAAAPADAEGEALWAQFLVDITQGDATMSAYLQRVAGSCASGVTSEDILPYFFGVGSNGKSSFAETLMAALGDYALVFAPEVMMEARGERHPTELAQFMGVRLALRSEPSSSATWNDSRVKALTGDATISARFMRGDNFTYRRSHKTIVIGNHMPKLNAVTHAIRRRMQMVPFNAIFAPVAGQGMRERLQEKALGAVLAWAIKGTVEWISRVPKVKLFKESAGRERSITMEQAQRLLAELPEHQRDIVMFAFATGLRHANVVGLTWSHVNLEACHAWVDGNKSKNGRPIAVPLNATAVEVLKRQVGKHAESVFTYNGRPIARANTHAWGKALKRAGIKISAGTTLGTPGRPGIVNQGHPPTSCSVWAVGGRL